MKLTRRKLILIAVTAGILLVTALIASLSGRNPVATPSPTVSAAPTADPIAADRAQLEQWSSELATKFRTFDKPDAAYLASIQPYVSRQFLADYRSTFRYADRVPFFKPVRSQVANVELTASSATKATANVTLNSTETQTSRSYQQVITITWEKGEERWVATDVETQSISPEVPNG